MRFLKTILGKGVLVCALAFSAATAPRALPMDDADPPADGLALQQPLGIDGKQPRGDECQVTRDILIVDTTRRNAFFGMYQLKQMTEVTWDFFARTIDWAIDYQDHATAKIWLATYNGTLDPQTDGIGLAAYDYLTNVMAFDPNNIHVDHQNTIVTGDFAGYDLLLYAGTTNPRDATNVLNQGIPFVTTSKGQTDEMGIGTGASTMHARQVSVYVVNNAHDITSTYPLGQVTLGGGDVDGCNVGERKRAGPP